MNPITVATAVVSFVSLLVAAYTAYVNASIENNLTRKFDERYSLRKETLLLVADRDHWRDDLIADRERWRYELNRRMTELAEQLRDQREIHERTRQELLTEIRTNREAGAELISALRQDIRGKTR